METKTKISKGKKIEYAFCILGGAYFIGRCLASWIFNI